MQLLPDARRQSYAKARFEVHERLDGTVAVFYRGYRLHAKLLTATRADQIPARAHRRMKSQGPSSLDALRRQKRKAVNGRGAQRTAKPAPDHPWRRQAQEGKRRKDLKEAGVTFSLNP